MQGPPRPLSPWFLELLQTWMAQQRWYAGKGRSPALRHIGTLRLEDQAAAVDIEIHLLRDESGQVPTTYQVPLTCRAARLAGADHALVATLEQNSNGRDEPAVRSDRSDRSDRSELSELSDNRYFYDGPHDPAFATALLQLMLEEGVTAWNGEQESNPEQALEGALGRCIAQGHRLTMADLGRLLTSRVLSGEQSNTSVILELADTLEGPSKPLICKLFRVLHHGQNPDVVVQSALAAAGSRRVPPSVGYVSGQWPDASAPAGVAAGHLAFAQEFLPGVEDAWRVALTAVTTGTDFSEQARSLGQATAEVHATLAQAMGTREATEDDKAALTASMRARHVAALAEVPALAAYDSMIRASIEGVSKASWPMLQRIHGDYHLGQVLDAPDRGWVLVDFEGEPLRPLAERSQPDLALRDVAGMLRSFDYAAGSMEQAPPGRSKAPVLDPAPLKTDPEKWATRARTAFLEGYTSGAGLDPRADAALLDALELDKALYEVVYEARNRPSWLSIPTTAIDRLARQARPSAG